MREQTLTQAGIPIQQLGAASRETEPVSDDDVELASSPEAGVCDLDDDIPEGVRKAARIANGLDYEATRDAENVDGRMPDSGYVVPEHWRRGGHELEAKATRWLSGSAESQLNSRELKPTSTIASRSSLRLQLTTQTGR